MLVLLTSPLKIKNHRHESVFRTLFQIHRESNLSIIKEFLSNNQIDYEIVVGQNEHSEPIIAFVVDEEPLFGYKAS